MIAIILFLLSILTVGVSPVFALTEDLAPTDCSSSASETCVTKGDGVNTVIPLSKTDSTIANIATSLLGRQKNAVMSWLGSIKPAGGYKISSPQFSQFAKAQDTAAWELTPYDFQKARIPDDAPKPFSMTSRLCVYNPETGALEGDFISNETITTDDVPGLRESISSARTWSSFTTGNVEGADYRLPQITIDQSAALPCGSQLSGEQINQTTTTANNQNSYGGQGGAVTSIVYRILSSMIHPVGSGVEATAEIPAKIVGTGQSPYSHAAYALSAGCNSQSDLGNVGYATDDQKKNLCESGGYIQSMYLMNGHSYGNTDPDASDPTQEWDNTITRSRQVAANSNSFQAGIEASYNYEACSLTAANEQGRFLPNSDCNQRFADPAALAGGDYIGTCPASEVAKINSTTNDIDGRLGVYWLPNPPPLHPTDYSQFYTWLSSAYPSNTHTDTSKLPNPTAVACLAEYADRFWPGNQFRAHLNQTINWALDPDNGWNPSLLMGIWLEESHAGQTGKEYGCGAQAITPADQLRCLETVDLNYDFSRFMCRFAGDCPENETQNTNPSFMSVMQFYNILTNWRP